MQRVRPRARAGLEAVPGHTNSEPKRNLERTTVTVKARKVPKSQVFHGVRATAKGSNRMLVEKVLYCAQVKATAGWDIRAARAEVDLLVEKSHLLCPYSNAMCGNVAVRLVLA